MQCKKIILKISGKIRSNMTHNLQIAWTQRLATLANPAVLHYTDILNVFLNILIHIFVAM